MLSTEPMHSSVDVLCIGIPAVIYLMYHSQTLLLLSQTLYFSMVRNVITEELSICLLPSVYGAHMGSFACYTLSMVLMRVHLPITLCLWCSYGFICLLHSVYGAHVGSFACYTLPMVLMWVHLPITLCLWSSCGSICLLPSAYGAHVGSFAYYTLPMVLMWVHLPITHCLWCSCGSICLLHSVYGAHVESIAGCQVARLLGELDFYSDCAQAIGCVCY